MEERWVFLLENHHLGIGFGRPIPVVFVPDFGNLTNKQG
jgi:hypothetical protein